MKLIEIQGLGAVSRAKACQIAVCDEMGCDETFNAKQAVIRVQRAEPQHRFTEKEIRQALFTLHRAGQLSNENGNGTYSWVKVDYFAIGQAA